MTVNDSEMCGRWKDEAFSGSTILRCPSINVQYKTEVQFLFDKLKLWETFIERHYAVIH